MRDRRVTIHVITFERDFLASFDYFAVQGRREGTDRRPSDREALVVRWAWALDLMRDLIAVLTAIANGVQRDSETEPPREGEPRKGAAIGDSAQRNSPPGRLSLPFAPPLDWNRVRGVVLASDVAGVFSAGLDLRCLLDAKGHTNGTGKSTMDGPTTQQFAAEAAAATDRFVTYWHVFQELAVLLDTYPLPVVASIEGNAPAAGAILALCCDARVMLEYHRYTNKATAGAGAGAAAETVAVRLSTIGIPAVRAGFCVPPWVAAMLTRTVAAARIAERMLCRGEMLSAQQAKEVGLIDAVVNDDPISNEPSRFRDDAPRSSMPISATDRLALLEISRLLGCRVPECTEKASIVCGDTDSATVVAPRVTFPTHVTRVGVVPSAHRDESRKTSAGMGRNRRTKRKSIRTLPQEKSVVRPSFWLVKEHFHGVTTRRFLGDARLRALDTKHFHDMIRLPAVQSDLGRYVAGLRDRSRRPPVNNQPSPR